jgi:uncharacterized protein
MDDENLILANLRNGQSDVVERPVHEICKTEQFAQYEEFVDYAVERGYLVPDDSMEEAIFAEELHRMVQNCQERSKIHAIVMTYDCNLQCAYCFERYRGEGVGRTMTKERIDRIYTIVQDFDHDQPQKNPINLFGGEPLLPEHREIVEYCLEKGHQLGYSFFVPTNGYSLESYAEILSRYTFSVIQVTLDGSQEVHDQRKILKSGKGGTFEQILKGIHCALDHDLPIRVRVNVDESNVNSLLPLMQRLEGEGWFERNNFSIYLSPCRHGVGRCFMDFEDALHVQTRTILKDFRYAHRVEVSSEVPRRVLSGGQAIRLSMYNCDACFRQFFYDPLGTIYPCAESIGNDAMRIGFYDPDLKFTDTYHHLLQRNLRDNPTNCRSCEHFLLCSGGCPYRALVDHGSLRQGDCGTFQEITKCLVNMARNAMGR